MRRLTERHGHQALTAICRGAATFAAVLTLMSATPAFATPLTVSGTTAGCFGLGCSAFATTATSDSNYGLTFTGANPFTALTDASGSAVDILIGSFARENVNVKSDDPSLPFTLQVTFSVPFGIEGGPDYVTALIQGTNTGGGGPLDVAFDNAWQLVTYSGPSGSGAFEFSVTNNPQVNKNNSASLYGAVRGVGGVGVTDLAQTPAPVPEPASLMLLGSGLIVVARAARRRARKTAA